MLWKIAALSNKDKPTYFLSVSCDVKKE